MSLSVLGVVFVTIFLAELPDKTALASLLLGTRYRAGQVFLGVAAAFLVHVLIAIGAGSLLRLIPHRPLEAVVAVLFALGAALLLREGGKHEVAEAAEELGPARTGLGPLRVIGTSFGVIFVAEFGDLTEILTANLVAKYHDPLAVGIGATLGLWGVGALGILGGRRLLDRVPLVWITRVAATIMIVLSALSVVSAIRG
ncbi:MAG TPA: TMEM165/GDT1 family protein [Mycobacteriales bacterium]